MSSNNFIHLLLITLLYYNVLSSPPISFYSSPECPISHCQQCLTPSSCNKCSPNYFISPVFGPSHCLPCTQRFCLECITPSACTRCVVGFDVVGGLCQRCGQTITNCYQCNYDMDNVYSQKCIQCHSRYFLAQNHCRQCPSYCLECTNQSVCLKCEAGFIKKKGVCQAGQPNCLYENRTSCVECLDYYYLDMGHCVACKMSGCLSCRSTQDSQQLQCLKCQYNYFLPLQSSVCQRCLPSCYTCQSSSSCSSCSFFNYLSLNGTCSPCPQDCSACTLNNETKLVDCISCLPQRYLAYVEDSIRMTCLACNIQNCDVCREGVDGVECGQCFHRYSVVNGSCIKCPLNCWICNSTTYCLKCQSSMTWSNGQCLKCPQGCFNCTSDKFKCLQCQNGFVMDRTGLCYYCSVIQLHCQTCISVQRCQKCSPSFYVTQSGICSKCHFNCSTCIAFQVCTTCKPGSYLSQMRTCLFCGQHCNRCIDVNFCIQCLQGNYIKQGICSLCPQGCSNCYVPQQCITCIFGYYMFNNTISPFGGQCLPCPALCSRCTNKSYCSQCVSRAYLKIIDNNRKQCMPCTDHCMDCTNDNNCQQCQFHYYRNNVTNISKQACLVCVYPCLGCLTKQICQNCIPGYYFVDTTTQGGICLPCQTHCKQCSGPRLCIQCQKGYYLSQYKDYPFNGIINDHYHNIVKDNSYEVACLACRQNCSSCKNAIQCTGCIQGFFLNETTSQCEACPEHCKKCFNSVCVSCQDGYYVNLDEGLPCQKCNSSCLKCINAKLCMKCDHGFYLVNVTARQAYCTECPSTCTKCTSNQTCQKCQPGRYLSYPSYHCLQCLQTCLICIDISGCDQCQKGYYLVSVPKQLQFICVKCPTGCLQCTKEGQCSQCQTGYEHEEEGVCREATQEDSGLKWWGAVLIVIATAVVVAVSVFTVRFVMKRRKQALRDTPQSYELMN